MFLSFILSSSLFASPQDFPDINVQYFRPAIDSQHFVWVNESATPQRGAVTFRSFLSYSARPLIYTSKDGMVTDVLKDLTQLDLVGGYSFGNLRVGVDIPFVVNAQGALPTGDSFSESALGDIAMDVKYRLTHFSSPIGVSVSVRGQFPTSKTSAAISTPEPMVEGELTIDTKQDKIHVAANIGHREQSDFLYEHSAFGSQIYLRGGLGFVPNETKGASLEFVTSRLYEFVDVEDAFSSEAMVSGWSKQGTMVVRGGVGMGIGSGIGTPQWRALASLEYLPSMDSGDKDRDGIADVDDQCVMQPEDIDGILDDDGCPDNTEVTVFFVDQFGDRVHQKKWNGGDFEGYSGVPFTSKAQDFTLHADIEGYIPVQQRIEVHDGLPQEIEVPITMLLGSVQVLAKNPQGDIIPDAVWSTAGSKERYQIGKIQDMKPQSHVVQVMADGYKLAVTQVQVRPQENSIVEVVLSPSKAQVKDGRINMEGVIHFETNSAVIESSSFLLLDDVADILRDFPAIELIRIEGHTDSDGKASMNKRLSQSRAESVVRYLIRKGITKERMIAVGFGEEKPIASNKTQNGKKKNRRVEMHIVDVDQSKVEGVHDFDFRNE
ncbi:MAG: hypothetical protein CL916_12150 [Deltaproteobacteria bacterium]|nr:hypothetical protein [Deltaproteobacteria bacterium]